MRLYFRGEKSLEVVHANKVSTHTGLIVSQLDGNARTGCVMGWGS